MDTKRFSEGDYLTVDAVKQSPSKKLVILSSGSESPDPKGTIKFGLLVEIDGLRKQWRPNKNALKKIQSKYGFESGEWIGKVIPLTIGQEGKFEAIQVGSF